jgi:hypothetical protein
LPKLWGNRRRGSPIETFGILVTKAGLGAL